MEYIKLVSEVILFIVGLAFIDQWFNIISFRNINHNIEQMRREEQAQRIAQERLLRNLTFNRPPSYCYPLLHCKYNESSNTIIRA